MKKYIVILFFTLSFSQIIYNVGDTVSLAHQNVEHQVCWGNEHDLNQDGVFSLAELNGDLNGGNYMVTVIKHSATW